MHCSKSCLMCHNACSYHYHANYKHNKTELTTQLATVQICMLFEIGHLSASCSARQLFLQCTWILSYPPVFAVLQGPLPACAGVVHCRGPAARARAIPGSDTLLQCFTFPSAWPVNRALTLSCSAGPDI